MKKLYLFFLIMCMGVLVHNKTILAKTESFSPDQTKQIQEIIRKYIIDNPAVLLAAGKKYQEQEAAKEQEQANKIKANVLKYHQKVFDTKKPGRVVTGNLDGKVIVAKFIQYQCPHCKVVEPYIGKLLKENPDVKLITIYWPFYGNDAVYAAKAALAAQKQNKFNELNQALLAVPGFVTQEKVDDIIKTIPGLDVKKLHKDMNARALDKGLKANIKLAQDLGLTGMPTLIIADKNKTKLSLILGQTSNFVEDLNQSLKAVR